jgi:ABC-type transport system involved in multi-copper enzyme maturation permease subunit
MNGTLIIARRELNEKRFVFVAALAFTALALIVPFMPGVQAGERRSALVMASLILSTAFTLGLAAILGSNIIGRELSDGRLSFYFSKPISAASIWFGKLMAAVLLVLVSFALIVTPAFLAGVGAVVRTWTPLRDALPTLRIILGTAAVFFLLGHVIGTLVRSRSAWIAFDFIAVAVSGAALWLLGRLLLLGFAVDLTKRLALIFSIYAALAIIVAGAWQVAQGRTDRKRSHMELSRFLWMSVGCGLLVLAAFVAWVVSVPMSQIAPDFALQSGDGSWAILGGTTKHRGDYRAAFLYNVADGRAVRVSALEPWWGSGFSGNGRIASWIVPTMGTGVLYIARLDSPKPQPIDTGITFAGGYSLSDDGSRVAAINRDGNVTVYDIASRASLGSARVPEGRYLSVVFESKDLVRIYSHNTPSLIFEYDVARKSLRQTGQLPTEYFRLNRSSTRALVVKRPNMEIRDARTGALLSVVEGDSRYGRFLRDGRILAIESSKLHLLTPDGVPIRDIALPAPMEPFPIVDAGDNLLVVVVRPENMTVRFAAAVIDLDRGMVLRVEQGVQPMFGGRGSRLLAFTTIHDVVLWNPRTGEKRVIVKHS